MRDFREYSPEDIILSNLRENAKRLDALEEQELSHLCDLAAEMLSMGDLQEILVSLPDHKPQSYEGSGDSLPENIPLLDTLHACARAKQALLLSDKLCTALTEKKGLTTDAIFWDFESVSKDSAVRIVYPKSNYTDSAYLAFSRLLGEPQATYTHSFVSACEEVYNGICDFCILPLENSTEGTLVGFLKLIAKFELKIAATCDIESHGEGRLTRFALLRKNLLPFLLEDERDRHFDLLIPNDPPFKLSELLSAAAFFGISAKAITFLPGDLEEKDAGIYVSLRTQNARLNAFLLYLSMELPNNVPIGLYPNIQVKGKN